MMALSLWPPWWEAIGWVPRLPTDPQPKGIENRIRWSERTPALHVARKLVGSRFLLHASVGHGSKADFQGACDMIVGILGPTVIPRLIERPRCAGTKPIAWPPASTLARGALVGRATLADIVCTTERGHRQREGHFDRRCVLCGGVGLTWNCAKADPWAMVGIGLVLADVEALAAPVKLPGHQGWFHVKDDLPGLQTP